MRTMVTAFAEVVDFQNYRLMNLNGDLSGRKYLDNFHLKQMADGLHPTLVTHDGAQPMGPLSFLSPLRDTFNILGSPEASEVSVLSHVLGGDARNVHVGQFYMVKFGKIGQSPDNINPGS